MSPHISLYLVYLELREAESRRVLVKKTVYLNDPRAARGDNVREHYEIQTDEAMKMRFRQAEWKVTQCEGQLRALAALAQRLGLDDEATAWSTQAEELGAAIRATIEVSRAAGRRRARAATAASPSNGATRRGTASTASSRSTRAAPRPSP